MPRPKKTVTTADAALTVVLEDTRETPAAPAPETPALVPYTVLPDGGVVSARGNIIHRNV